MKIERIEGENENQRILREALDLLENGRRHVVGTFRVGDRFCMWGAMSHVAGYPVQEFDYRWPVRSTAHDIMEAVLGTWGICGFNNSTPFPKIADKFVEAYAVAGRVR